MRRYEYGFYCTNYDMMDFSATGDNSLVVRQSKNDEFGGLEK